MIAPAGMSDSFYFFPSAVSVFLARLGIVTKYGNPSAGFKYALAKINKTARNTAFRENRFNDTRSDLGVRCIGGPVGRRDGCEPASRGGDARGRKKNGNVNQSYTAPKTMCGRSVSPGRQLVTIVAGRVNLRN